MSDWNTEEVNGTSADGEQTNGFEANGAEANGTQANGASIGPKEEDLAKAREAGWTERTVHNYNDGDASAVDWAGAAAKYEWSDEYGEVGPEVPELERTLFGGEFQMRRGDHISNLELLVGTEGRTQIAPVREFADARIHPVVLNNIKLANYDKPTPIQAYTIPAVLQGYDVVAIAQTGSGKTAAYMIPIISKLMGKAKKLQAPRPNTRAPDYNARLHKVKAEPLVVIVVPTRELAVQIFNEACRMCYRSMLRPCAAYGGRPMGQTIDDLGLGCDILVATPGRLCDLMDKPHILTMGRVKFTVIDEADEMLHSDWDEELRKIMAGGDTNEDADHVYMMFSATFPKEVRKMAAEYMAQDYFRVRVGRAGSAHKNIRQNVVWVDGDKKRDAVYDLLFEMEPARTIIFCNSKIQVDLLDDFLFNKGLPTTSIHGDRQQREREDNMRAFRTGKCPILIATGISARGWDIKDCKHVINFDLPSGTYGGITEYVHRIGRTARIGHQGLATSFYNDKNDDIAQDLVNHLLENECTVPDFLQQYVPEDGNLNFDDNSEDEGAGENGANGEEGGGFGEANGDDEGVTAPAGWGTPTEAAADTGFAAEEGFSAAATDAGW